MVSNTSKVVLGIDPGLVTLGLAVLSGDGEELVGRATLTTSPADGDEVHRADLLADRVAQALSEVEQGVGMVAIETQHVPDLPRGRQDYTAAMRELRAKAGNSMWVAYVAGAVAQVARGRGIPVVMVSPAEAKRALTGNAQATKSAMQEMARVRFGADLTEHEADALGIALAAEQKAAGRPTRAEARGVRREALEALPERVRVAAARGGAQ